ncbi:MAG: hypothetical protein HZA94_00125 [Candidatus Vogelbacteria bacterium]|nr:hypothetical protein [Candidatus Vogelbacteria bacterium]
MNKPYVTKLKEVAGKSVWIVDGFYIRKNMEINFNNFGQHFRFNFIPENEFWIDVQVTGGEENLFIEHLLLENKLMAEGKSFNDAADEAGQLETDMRIEDPKVFNLKLEFETKPEAVYKEIRRKFLKKYSNDAVRTYLVDSGLVRGIFYNDWVSGGHDKVYRFVPSNEVWIDDDITDEERPYVILHEIHERHLMDNGQSYPEAHNSACKTEQHCQKNPGELEAKIKEELQKQ